MAVLRDFTVLPTGSSNGHALPLGMPSGNTRIRWSKGWAGGGRDCKARAGARAGAGAGVGKVFGSVVVQDPSGKRYLGRGEANIVYRLGGFIHGVGVMGAGILDHIQKEFVDIDVIN
jgi:hypothetical protein